jgi:hypothetical protein
MAGRSGMRRAPYSRDVEFAADVHRAASTRVLVFAGPRAWDWSRWWRDVADPGIVRQARQRYTTLLPPDSTATAETYRWPVRGRRVVIADTGAGVDALAPLVRALQRDGCGDGEIIDISTWSMAWFAEQRLRALQPWLRATFDAEVEARAAAIDRAADVAIAESAIRLLCAAETDPDQAQRDLQRLCALPRTSIAGEALGRVIPEIADQLPTASAA